jgi:hypothetical protein
VPAVSNDNGVTWTVATWATTLPGGYFHSIAYGNGVFVIQTPSGYHATSANGADWSHEGVPIYTGTTTSVSYQGQVEFNGTEFIGTPGGAGGATSPDGYTWTQKSIPGGVRFESARYEGIIAATGGNVIYTSPDGIALTAIYTDPNGTLNEGMQQIAVGRIRK